MRPTSHSRRVALAVSLGCSGCADPLLDGSAHESDLGSGPVDEDLDLDAVMMDAPCALDPTPRGLLLSTTDFASGALSVVDLDTREVTVDVALSTSDAVPHWHEGRAYVVHRFMFDYLDVLQTDPWRSVAQHPIHSAGVQATNPRSVAFGPDGLAYLPLHETGEIAVLDLSQPPGSSLTRTIDLAAFADDGNPDPSLAFACGNTLWVSVEQLDAAYARIGPDALVPVDLSTQQPIDLSPDRPGGQGVAVAGAWIKQIRLDPTDPSGHTVLALTSGIERIDLRTGAVSWAVSPQTLAAVGVVHHQLPLAFDLDDDGTTAYLAAYGRPELDCAADPGPCFAMPARLLEIDLDETDPSMPRVIADGFDAVAPTLEVAGEQLWYASRTVGASGLFVYDLSTDPPSLIEGPITTGLAPYAMTVIGP